ncbi:MAG: hypothetical protein M1826_007651 [Phylliscum demangeonii]|nr:MAG: hypothetical protein M1826_007651 [Phylliscum demangeonii]
MVSDAVYDLCVAILRKPDVEEEDKTDRLEDLLRSETKLTGPSLENAVLDVLWRFREAVAPSPSPPPARHIVLRRPSPAPWQLPRGSTPLPSSPGSGSISLAPPPALVRAKSSAVSPFVSPRPSPRLAFSSPLIPHSPNLNAYVSLHETTPGPDISGEYESDNVDWLVNDDAASVASSTGAAAPQFDHAASMASMSMSPGPAAAWLQPQQVDMSPYDILRSVLGYAKTDEEIEGTLQASGYDLTTAIMVLMGHDPSMGHDPMAGMHPLPTALAEKEASVVVGRTMTPDPAAHAYAALPPRSTIMCKYFLSSGTCLRADCRFSHDPSAHLCKYWLMGNCLAGDHCPFSHDPAMFLNRLAVDDNGGSGLYGLNPMQDYPHAFPALSPPPQAIPSQGWAGYGGGGHYSIDAMSYPGSYNSNSNSNHGNFLSAPPGLFGHPGSFLGGEGGSMDASSSSKRSRSRPNSRHPSRAPTPSLPSVDDPDAFPTLGSSNAKASNKGKHPGKRGGAGSRQTPQPQPQPQPQPAPPPQLPRKESSTLADIVRMSPSPAPAPAAAAAAPAPTARKTVPALAIPAPRHLPWLATTTTTTTMTTGAPPAHAAYVAARQTALKHGALRNKFLQSAAQAWHRNDARAAKALSLRGQSENELMRLAHREAARLLYEEGAGGECGGAEIFIDLQGLLPLEAAAYLGRVLLEHDHVGRPEDGDDPLAAAADAGDGPGAAATWKTTRTTAGKKNHHPPPRDTSTARSHDDHEDDDGGDGGNDDDDDGKRPSSCYIYAIVSGAGGGSPSVAPRPGLPLAPHAHAHAHAHPQHHAPAAHHPPLKTPADKLSRAARAFLDEWAYAYREFSPSGAERTVSKSKGNSNSSRSSSSGGGGGGGGSNGGAGAVVGAGAGAGAGGGGGILGIDPRSWDRSRYKERVTVGGSLDTFATTTTATMTTPTPTVSIGGDDDVDVGGGGGGDGGEHGPAPIGNAAIPTTTSTATAATAAPTTVVAGLAPAADGKPSSSSLSSSTSSSSSSPRKTTIMIGNRVVRILRRKERGRAPNVEGGGGGGGGGGPSAPST